MRFFSHEWSAIEDDAIAKEAVEDYNLFLLSLAQGVGRKIRDFVRNYSLQDALLDYLFVSKTRRHIEFRLIAGDNANGYVLLILSFTGAELIVSGLDEISFAFWRRSAVIRYDEFDRATAQQTYVHRFLLWPRSLGEFEIHFEDFSVTQTPLASRQYLTYGEPIIIE